MINILFIIIMSLISASAVADDIPSQAELKKTADELHAVVGKYEVENFDYSNGVYVIDNATISNLTLYRMPYDKVTQSFASCLMNTDASTYASFQGQLREIFAAYGTLEWYTDNNKNHVFTNDPSFPLVYGGDQNYTNIKKIYFVADEYGGPGWFYPNCSVLVKTAMGVSFLFHAIDTY